LSRAVVLLPDRANGPVRWAVEVRSGDETAIVYLDTEGNITRVNLANTARFRNLKMFERPELVVDAVNDVVTAIGRGAQLTRVSFSATSIGFDTTIEDRSHPIVSRPTSSLKATASLS